MPVELPPLPAELGSCEVPTGYVDVMTLLESFFNKLLGPEAGLRRETEFEPGRAVIRRALVAETLIFSLQTTEALIKIPSHIWDDDDHFANIFRTGNTFYQPFIVNDKTLSARGILCIDVKQAEDFVRHGGFRIPYNIPAQGELLLRFWEIRSRLFGDIPCKKKDVLNWFRQNWPAELEDEWDKERRLTKPVFHRNKYGRQEEKFPNFVWELAGIALPRAERGGGNRTTVENKAIAARKPRKLRSRK